MQIQGNQAIQVPDDTYVLTWQALTSQDVTGWHCRQASCRGLLCPKRKYVVVCGQISCCWWLPEASSCSCVPAGIFRETVISRKGAYSCPVASGVIFAVNVDVRGAAGAPADAYSQALLASMQARAPSWASQTAGSTVRHGGACAQSGCTSRVQHGSFAGRLVCLLVLQKAGSLLSSKGILCRVTAPPVCHELT